jgi:hypothetical protein
VFAEDRNAGQQGGSGRGQPSHEHEASPTPCLLLSFSAINRSFDASGSSGQDRLTPLTGVVGSQKIPRARSKIEPDQFYFSKVTTKHGGEIKMWHTTL